jgi:hypothetical protein
MPPNDPYTPPNLATLYLSINLFHLTLCKYLHENIVESWKGFIHKPNYIFFQLFVIEFTHMSTT